MEKTSLELQRAKRRYKALQRERATLAVSGKTDPLTEAEIQKLEKEYPELVQADTEGPESTFRCKVSSPLAANESSSELESSTTDAAPNSRSTSSSPAAQPSSQLRLRKSAPPSLIMQTPVLPTPPSSSQRADAITSNEEDAHKRHAGLGNYFMIMFALQLFNERHQKPIMTRLHVIVVALLSVAAAAAHCTFVDPVSIPGSLLSPSLFALLVHANAVCGVYVRRKRRFTAPMLIIYTVFDIFPSLGLSIVCYNLGLIALECYGFQRASSAC
ncbi:hypothetical protein N2W54_003006 [Lotmaria passim]